jgi:pSer/pThr/pTyr-binding forkhead associated (FHA) protein
MRFVWLAVAFLAFIGTAPADAQTSVGDILNNPGQYNDTQVSVEGTVARVLAEDEGNYMLEDEDGNQIRVRYSSDMAPSEGNRLTVEGLVSISAFNREPYITENNRSAATGSQSSETPEERRLESEGNPFTIIGIIGLLITVAIIGSGYYLWKREEEAEQRREEKRAQAEPEAAEAAAQSEATQDDSDLSVQDTELQGNKDSLFPDSDGPTTDEPERRIKSESSSSTANQPESPETLKFKAPPKTMKFIPGKLVIISGPDKGREFRIAGFPREEEDGNVVTIGRADVKGERAFAHIQLGDTYRTVSRIQAEIIQKTSSNEVYLRNKSTTNPTEVNNEQVPPEETVELQNEDTIQMGELVLRYEV